MQVEPIDTGLVAELTIRIFGDVTPLSVERVKEGVSTYVYRIRRASEVFYLRVLPEEGASFAPEAHVHALLRKRGVSVPEVICYEHYNAALQRSVMVTTEIKGRPIGPRSLDAGMKDIVVAAGRDLAIINSLTVEGFGWIRRDGAAGARLTAELPTHRAFVLDHLEQDLALMGKRVLSQRETALVWEIIARHEAWLGGDQARLAHGDFDMTHIYARKGRYSGIIDFGEIRGADALYDLGHFMLHDGETLPHLTLPYLLEGYQQVAPLPPDYEGRLRLTSLLIAVKALARRLWRHPAERPDHLTLAALRGGIDALAGTQSR